MKKPHLIVGCGRSVREDCYNLDLAPLPGVDYVFDLETCHLGNRLPIEDNTFERIIMSHLIEHINHPLAMMQELWRVAKPGCDLLIRCPYGSSDNAWTDPTHVRPYFLDSFGFFSQAAYGGADYGYRGDWKTVDRYLRISPAANVEGLENDLDQMLSVVMTFRNIVDEMFVTLKAVKPAREPGTFMEQAPLHFIFPNAGDSSEPTENSQGLGTPKQ